MELESIYLAYHDKVSAYLTGRLGNADEVKDLCADVFVKVAAAMDTFDPQKASLSTWIYCITRNTLVDRLRTRPEPVAMSDDIPAPEDLAESLCREEMLEALADALELLPARERELIVRRYYHGQTLKQIAAGMNLSYSYIKLLHRTALIKMKNFLEKQ